MQENPPRTDVHTSQLQLKRGIAAFASVYKPVLNTKRQPSHCGFRSVV